ncbi:hypothetical protein [Alteromonas sp. a30]|uniref:hypothetical protein n=1 Tax=Alteromonas sp. a30 TaxID=2730917 RepID=UPI002282A014|nr:hypothetical protein [Alteromonas sp. a30]MCY7297002.1 hypothetical protein [Alteromonas sp. a30]
MYRKAIAFSLFFVLTLCACTDAKQKTGAGKYGMMDSSTPEGAALLFFEALYSEKRDINLVISYSTPKMGRLLKSYHTTRSVQRHVLNLPYDNVPEMQIDTGDDVGRSEFATDTEISVFFTGLSNGDKVDDLRTVEMLRIKNKWLVNAIKADKYL